jgi:hypothetical protein
MRGRTLLSLRSSLTSQIILLTYQFYRRLWPDDDVVEENEPEDIESSIESEISQLKSKKEQKPFHSVKMAQECGTT